MKKDSKTTDCEEIYNHLMEMDYTKLNTQEAIEALSILIDISCDLKKIYGLKYAIEQSKNLLSNNLTKKQKSIVHYFLANSWQDCAP